jgi:two-component system CheB/CheR fusion protein
MDHHGYRVRPELRETLLFACHDLLRDSPFSRMNLVSCRNLLIYLNRDAQGRAFDIFAFALWPEGRLFLGLSELVDEGSQLFVPLDKKNRIYLHRSASRPILSLPVGPGTLARALHAQDQPRERPESPADAPAAEILAMPGTPQEGEPADRRPLPWSELHFRLIERLAPPSLVVNEEYDIVHLSESAGRYLQFTAGELKRNLLALVHPMLRIQLRAALFQATQSRAPVDIPGVPVEIEGARRTVNIRIRPAADLAPDFLLVILEPGGEAAPAAQAPPAERREDQLIAQRLDREMESMKSRLRETVEQYEASTEELKASNEELQAMNEELRSATEELETGREELQSINEELTTVNQELKSKLDELSHANSDLHNLMVSTAIPTIFLDRDLRIMRYTPSAVKIFNLIPTDIGRPLTDLKHRLHYPGLDEDTRNVLVHLSSIEHEVRDERDGRWFLSRLLPYRTMDDQVAGVVLTLVNISEIKRSAAALEKSESRFRALVTQAKAGIVETDLARRFTYVNDRFCEITGRDREELLSKEIREVMPHEDVSRDSAAFERMIATGTAFERESRFVRPDGTALWTVGTFTRLDDPEGNGRGILAVIVDLTEHRRAMEDLEHSRAELWEALMENERVRRELEAAGQAKDHFLAVLSHELRTPLTPVLMAVRMLGRRSDLPPDFRESLEMIRRNVQIEAQFVDDLLDVTRIERGKLEIVREPVNVHTVIRQAVAIAENELHEKRQELAVDLGAANFQVIGDPTRLQQVMWNLLKNGSKFSPEEGKIRVGTWNEDGRILISIADGGIGIDPSALSLIFDPFRQENRDITRQFGGLGLGLAIARATVDAHGGTLRAESPGRGAGATFIVDLPLDKPPQPPGSVPIR